MKPKPSLAIIACLFSVCSVAQQPLVFRDSSVRGPQTFAIIVGISKYKFVRPLTYADKDAELFRDYLLSPGGGSVSKDNIFCLLNEQANNQNFWGKGFQWLKAKNLQRGDKLFFYLAGHGDAIDEDQFFFLGYDCNPGGDKNNYLISGAIQLFNLKKKIANETARGVEVIFIMDACRSDELPGGTDGQNFFNSAVTEKKAGEIIMLATGAGQESLEDESIGNGHGLFTYYLVDGLIGTADSLDTPDQEITFREIETFVNRHVPAIAQQRFRRKQEPFFCCNENSEKVIARVNRTYFLQWKSRQRGPGNSVNVFAEKIPQVMADTLLQETYDRFYQAVRSRRWTGSTSAETYYNMLARKFPGNKYTLDAKSTLAVEYMTEAQTLVDQFIGCQALPGDRREQYDHAADALEKAIRWFREDDAEFAQSLYGRLYLLRSLGAAENLANAHAARLFDPNGAYAYSRLADLHFREKNYDSAHLYAKRAVSIAPNWPCAVQLLNRTKENADEGNPSDKNRPLSRPRVGIMLAAGTNEPRMEPSPDRDPTIIAVDPGSRSIVEAGIVVDFPIGSNFHIRPASHISIVQGDVVYQLRPQTGGPVITQTQSTRYSSINIPLGFIYYFGSRDTRPYIGLAPVPSFVINDRENAGLFKKFAMLGEASAGVSFQPGKSRIRISPELRYSRALTDQYLGETGGFPAIETLKKQSFLFTIYITR